MNVTLSVFLTFFRRIDNFVQVLDESGAVVLMIVMTVAAQVAKVVIDELVVIENQLVVALELLEEIFAAIAVALELVNAIFAAIVL